MNLPINTSAFTAYLKLKGIETKDNYLRRGRYRSVMRGARGAQFPGRRKVTMSQVLSSTAHLLPKGLGFENGGAKLVFALGAI